MASSTFTQAELDALNRAIAQGARRVKYQDREVTYNTFEDMMRLRTLMCQELGVSSTPLPARKVMAFNKGHRSSRRPHTEDC